MEVGLTGLPQLAARTLYLVGEINLPSIARTHVRMHRAAECCDETGLLWRGQSIEHVKSDRLNVASTLSHAMHGLGGQSAASTRR